MIGLSFTSTFPPPLWAYVLLHHRLRFRCTCAMLIGIFHRRPNSSSNISWLRSSWWIVHLHPWGTNVSLLFPCSGDDSKIPTVWDLQRSLTAASNMTSNEKSTPMTPNSLLRRPALLSTPVTTDAGGGLRPSILSPRLKAIYPTCGLNRRRQYCQYRPAR